MTSSSSMGLDARSRHLRRLVLDTLMTAGRGHPGPALSLVEILRVLYDEVMRIRPRQADWPERDRFILSKGHGCLALYAILADKGFFPVELLATFCGQDSALGGHPERGSVPGVEASTGALGHGLSIGVGQALGVRLRGLPSRVFVLMGDGEINEGSVWEAAMSAAKHRLGNLMAIIDYNKIQSYGATQEVMPLEPLADKWRSFGFAVREADGHDLDALRQAFAAPPDDQPTVVICHTVKGKGIPIAEGNLDWHHKNRLKPEEVAAIRNAVGGG